MLYIFIFNLLLGNHCAVMFYAKNEDGPRPLLCANIVLQGLLGAFFTNITVKWYPKGNLE